MNASVKKVVLNDPNLAVRDYFAAHAPPPPTDFPKLERMQEVVEPDGPTRKRIVNQRVVESMLDHQVRWAWCYADAMVKARSK